MTWFEKKPGININPNQFPKIKAVSPFHNRREEATAREKLLSCPYVNRKCQYFARELKDFTFKIWAF